MPKYEAAAVRSGKHSPELSSTNWRGGGDSKGLPWASTWRSAWKNPPKGNIAEHKLQCFSSETRLHPCILGDEWESRYHNLQTQTILRQWHSLWENGSAVGALETRDHVLFGVKYSNPQIPSQGQLQTLFWDSPHGVQWHKSQPQCLGAVVPYVIHLWSCGEKCRFAKIKIKDFLHSRD